MRSTWRAFASWFAEVADASYVPPPIEIRIAGNVCSKLHATSPSVRLLGHVPSVEEYYQGYRCRSWRRCRSPRSIQIKVGKGAELRQAVIATQNGFDGFLRPRTNFVRCRASTPSVIAVIKLAFDRERLECREPFGGLSPVWRGARRRELALAHHRAVVESRRLHTKPGAVESGHHRAGRLAQWAEYCSHRWVAISFPPAKNRSRLRARQQAARAPFPASCAPQMVSTQSCVRSRTCRSRSRSSTSSSPRVAEQAQQSGMCAGPAGF